MKNKLVEEAFNKRRAMEEVLTVEDDVVVQWPDMVQIEPKKEPKSRANWYILALCLCYLIEKLYENEVIP